MRYFLAVLIVWLAGLAHARYGLFPMLDDMGGVVLDSKEWVIIGVEMEGSSVCAHDFVYSQALPKKGSYFVSCLVNHNGFHCNWNNLVRERICRLCGRIEKQEEIWHEHYEPPPAKPKTEFEILKDSFTK